MSRFSSVWAMVAPTTAPNEPRSSASALRSRRPSRTAPATVGPAVVRADWNCGPSGFEVRARTKRPAPEARASSIAGWSEPKPRYGLTVRASQASGPFSDRYGGRVARHGGADVAALGVDDHQGAGLAEADRGLLQYGDARRAEALEEGGLRLEHGDVLGQRVDHAVRERRQAFRRCRAGPRGRAGGVRVDPDAERAALVHRRAQTGTERLVAHGTVLALSSMRPEGGSSGVPGRGRDRSGRCRAGPDSRRHPTTGRRRTGRGHRRRR